MRLLMILGLLMHGLIETAMGLALVLSPTTLVSQAEGAELYGLINQGMMALATVAVTVWTWLNRREASVLSLGLATLALFHSSLVVAAAIIASRGSDVTGYAHHLILAVCFWVVWAGRRRLCLPRAGSRECQLSVE